MDGAYFLVVNNIDWYFLRITTLPERLNTPKDSQICHYSNLKSHNCKTQFRVLSKNCYFSKMPVLVCNILRA